LTLDLSDYKVAIFIGGNGAEKSSVLDAAAIALTRVTAQLRVHGTGKRHRLPTDINNQKTEACIQISVEHNATQYAWSLSRRGRKTSKQAGQFLISNLADVKTLATTFAEELNQEKVNIPLFAYYPVNRTVLDITLKQPLKASLLTEQHYICCYCEADGRSAHCGHKKGTQLLPISPIGFTDPAPNFIYAADGNIYPKPDNNIAVSQTISILGLNAHRLVNLCKAEISTVIYELASRAKEDRAQFTARLSPDSNSKLPSFVSARQYQINGRIPAQ